MLSDTHAHLSFPALSSEIDTVIDRAIEAGVTRIVTIGTDLEDSANNLTLTERFPGVVFAAVGVHPTSVTEISAPDWLEQLRDMANHPGCVAIGETGTDHFHPAPEGFTEDAYHGRQNAFFTAQLELAAASGKNVVVHQRESLADTIPLLAPFDGKLRSVFHCFVDSWETAAPLVRRGHLVSFTGIATFKNAQNVQACAAVAETGTFMLETDAPFLAPSPHRGKRNEPAFTRHTAEHIASLRGVSLQDLATETETTANNFFGW